MNSKTHSIKVVPVQPQETEALLALYIDLFHDREPLTRCGGLTRARMAEIAPGYEGAGIATQLIFVFSYHGFLYLINEA